MRIYLVITLLFLNACINFPAQMEVRGNSQSNVTTTPISDNPPLKIYIPYVGQGDGSLLQLPNGKTLMIDAGPPAAGNDALLPLLRTLNLSSLDALLVTHYDKDHLGGVPSLLAGEDGALGTDDDIQVGTDYDRGGEQWDKSPGRIPYMSALDTLKIPRVVIEAGQTIDLDQEVSIKCIAVNGSVIDNAENILSVDLTPSTYSGQENASSIALLIEYKNFRYLTAGDLTGGGSPDGFLTPDIESLVADVVGKVDVLHVDHHGSMTSSNLHFVETTAPEAVFIQAGINNPYGHPVPEVVDRWKSVEAEIYSTQGGQGYVLSTDGEGFGIESL